MKTGMNPELETKDSRLSKYRKVCLTWQQLARMRPKNPAFVQSGKKYVRFLCNIPS